MSGKEKRRAERQNTIDVTYISNNDGTFKGSITDISLSGVRFVLDREIPKRFIIDVNINYNPINFVQKAHVIWSKKKEDGYYEYGAEFINVARERLMLLEDHILDIKKAILTKK